MEINYTKNIQYRYKEDDPWLLTTQFGKIKLDIFSRKSSEKKRKEKEKRASFPRKGIDWQKDTAHVRVFIYIYIYMITHRQPAIITKERESGRTHE
jgi:hypothetical protein